MYWPFSPGLLKKPANGRKLPRQAYNRIRSQRFVIDHQTAGFHPLDFLREDWRELSPKHLCQLRKRYPHFATQFRYNKFLRWLIHYCDFLCVACLYIVRDRCTLLYTCHRRKGRKWAQLAMKKLMGKGRGSGSLQRNVESRSLVLENICYNLYTLWVRASSLVSVLW